MANKRQSGKYGHLQTGELKRLGNKTPWLIPRQIIALKRRDRDLPAVLERLSQQTTTTLDRLTTEAKRVNNS